MIVSDKLRHVVIDWTKLKVAAVITEGFLYNLSQNEHIHVMEIPRVQVLLLMPSEISLIPTRLLASLLKCSRL